MLDISRILSSRDPGEKEFHQAVREVLDSVAPVLERHPEYRREAILERLIKLLEEREEKRAAPQPAVPQSDPKPEPAPQPAPKPESTGAKVIPIKEASLYEAHRKIYARSVSGRFATWRWILIVALPQLMSDHFNPESSPSRKPVDNSTW